MRIRSVATSAAVAAAAILAWPVTASALGDLTIPVHCAAGQTIGQALGRPTVFDRNLVIVVSGTCNENVTITRDDVTIRSAGGGGVAATDPGVASIVVDGARRVALEGLVVTGGHEGIRITNGGSATIRNSTVHNAGLHGVLVLFGANARIENSVLESNGQYGLAVNGATATMVGSSVHDNYFSGIVVVNASALNLGQVDDAGNVCCGNTIENNRLDGVTVSRNASARLYGNTIRANGRTTNRWGVLTVEQSTTVLEGGNTLTGNGGATFGGGAYVRGSVLRATPGDTPVIPGSNEISGNAVGVQAYSSSLELGGGLLIAQNATGGINLNEGSHLRSNGITVTDNGTNGIFVNSGSTASFGGAAASNVSNNHAEGILLFAGSGVFFSNAPANVTGNSGSGINAALNSAAYFNAGPTSNVNVSGNSQFGLYCGPASYYSGTITGIGGNGAQDVVCSTFPVSAPPEPPPPPPPPPVPPA